MYLDLYLGGNNPFHWPSTTHLSPTMACRVVIGVSTAVDKHADPGNVFLFESMQGRALTFFTRNQAV